MDEMPLNEQFDLNTDEKRLKKKVAYYEVKNKKNVMNKKVKEYIRKRAEDMEKALFRK